ncbi:hypothetical protein PCANC_27919 [Puccinia coronata f. sp. avenae]|uniref:hAT-like transposase RNase-H fold domain-containing protein n=2 Tax=Puccinia coronata f. sp. avenae TaxID=200324 RepID=A0A2N5TD78_9BASI|nr:hypothetical protein PCANC_27919 [Puccinia coronata f. sp. avenae]
MAQILEGIVGDEIPSTPPETNQERQNNPPGSIQRESSRIRTPSTRPGFVRTESDSRLALGSKPSWTQINRSRKATIRTPVTDKTNISELGNDREDSVSIVEQHQTSLGKKQVCLRTAKAITVDTIQDSDEENQKVSRKKKDITKDKDGFDHDSDNTSFACQWCPKSVKCNNGSYWRCPKSVKCNNGSYWNLKSHQDGANLKYSKRAACTGRSKSIEAGCHLPPTAAEKVAIDAQEKPAGSGTLIAYTMKALQAHYLYVEQRSQVLKAIMESDWKISLASDVWTTKGSHKAFTTDSGSNNFTMSAGVVSIFRQFDQTDWDVKRNHHRCVCHVIALILGAGLKALKLSKSIVRPEKVDKYFPVLEAINEEPEDIEELMKKNLTTMRLILTTLS